MDNYNLAAERASRVVTNTFSTSFSSAITLFDKSIRQDIYNIYGLVRIADEIVDSYAAKGTAAILKDLESEVYDSLTRGFSSNIVVHAFCMTARKFAIDASLIRPFFRSMYVDISAKTFTQEEYDTYIYGSAEVVGLMCLRVFTAGDTKTYDQLKGGASALGSAFQKVNFLRDLSDDYRTRGRYYFPIGSYEHFDEPTKSEIIVDIRNDLGRAEIAIAKLPDNARLATRLAYDYYQTLLLRLEQLPVSTLLEKRVSVSKSTKLRLLISGKLKSYVR